MEHEAGMHVRIGVRTLGAISPKSPVVPYEQAFQRRRFPVEMRKPAALRLPGDIKKCKETEE